MKKLLLFTPLIFLIFSCGDKIHSDYYRSPAGEGYHKQVVGISCCQCGRKGAISWAQYYGHKEVKCRYCGNMMNTKQSSAVFKYDTDREDEELNVIANAYFNSGFSSRRSYSSSCERKTFIITVNGEVKFCNQYSTCRVNCL